MQRIIWASVLAAGLSAGVPNAAPGAPAPAAAPAAATEAPDKTMDALHHQYPNGKFETVETHEVNGVKVTTFKVTNAHGTAMARVTEHGDFMLSGIPLAADKLPHPVTALTHDLFKTAPTDVRAFTVTRYNVDIKSGGHQSRVVLNAVGHLDDFKGFHEMAQLDRSIDANAVTDPAETAKLTDFVKKEYGDKIEIESINKDVDYENFYIVRFKNAQGRAAQCETNGETIFSHGVVLPESEVPAAVINTVTAMFKGDKIVQVSRRRHNFYEVTAPTTGGDVMTMDVGANGEVIHVRSLQGHQEDQAIVDKNAEVMVGGSGHKTGG